MAATFDASEEQKLTTLSKYVKHDSTIPTSDHSSVLMFTQILTFKQWELEMIPVWGNRWEMRRLQKQCHTGEMQHFVLSFKWKTTNHATNRETVCLIFLKGIMRWILLIAWRSLKLPQWFQLLSITRLWFDMVKNLMLSSVFPKNTIPQSKRSHERLDITVPTGQIL